jgi:hypothetical protein
MHDPLDAGKARLPQDDLGAADVDALDGSRRVPGDRDERGEVIHDASTRKGSTHGSGVGDVGTHELHVDAVE